jgi:hypothetical protein
MSEMAVVPSLSKHLLPGDGGRKRRRAAAAGSKLPRYAVDRKLVAAYAVVGDRLKRAPLASLAGANLTLR